METFTILTGEYDACPQSKLIQTEIMYDVYLTVTSLYNFHVIPSSTICGKVQGIWDRGSFVAINREDREK